MKTRFSVFTRRVHRLSLLTVAAAALLVGGAQGRSISAFAGRSVNNSNTTCFDSGADYGSVINTCTSVQNYDVPMTIDTAGYKQVWVTAMGQTAANNVGCQSFGLDAAFTTVWTSGSLKYLPVFGVQTDIALNSVYVPAFGILAVGCQVSPQARVRVVNWSPQ